MGKRWVDGGANDGRVREIRWISRSGTEYSPCHLNHVIIHSHKPTHRHLPSKLSTPTPLPLETSKPINSDSMADLELTLAIENGNSDEVKRLLDSGIPLRIDQFLTAVLSKNIAILDKILSSGWDINKNINDNIPSALV